jgi:hypothetical protein
MKDKTSLDDDAGVYGLVKVLGKVGRRFLAIKMLYFTIAAS